MICDCCSKEAPALWKADLSKSIFDTVLLCSKCKEIEAVQIPHLKGRKIRHYMPKPTGYRIDLETGRGISMMPTLHKHQSVRIDP